METFNIDEYIDARRRLLRWRAASKSATTIVEVHFPPTHALRKAVLKLCLTMPGEFRFQADGAACRDAEIHGDSVFRRKVDGVMLLSPVDYFYGESLREHERRHNPQRTAQKIRNDKSLSICEVSVLHTLEQHARGFMRAVEKLPTGARVDSAAGRRLKQCHKKFQSELDRIFILLGKVCIDHAQTLSLIACLRRQGLSNDICRFVVGYLF